MNGPTVSILLYILGGPRGISASVVRHEPLIKFEIAAQIAPIGPRAWAAIHDPIDFYFLPDVTVAKFIDRTMKSIKSPGWLVIAKSVDGDSETLRWQRLLAESYVATEEIDFNSYHAIRYAPKLAGGTARRKFRCGVRLIMVPA